MRPVGTRTGSLAGFKLFRGLSLGVAVTSVNAPGAPAGVPTTFAAGLALGPSWLCASGDLALRWPSGLDMQGAFGRLRHEWSPHPAPPDLLQGSCFRSSGPSPEQNDRAASQDRGRESGRTGQISTREAPEQGHGGPCLANQDPVLESAQRLLGRLDEELLSSFRHRFLSTDMSPNTAPSGCSVPAASWELPTRCSSFQQITSSKKFNAIWGGDFHWSLQSRQPHRC
jgi:hypothetical protein